MSQEMIQHCDLLMLYFDEELPEVDFPFISNGIVYTFHVDTFEYLLEEYKAEHVTDSISTVNGDIEQMLVHNICSLGCSEETMNAWKQNEAQSALTIVFENIEVREQFLQLLEGVLGVETNNEDEHSDNYGNELRYKFSNNTNILTIRKQ
jgi:hypothetical protein